MDVDKLHSFLQTVCPVEGVAGPFDGSDLWVLYPAKDGSQWRIDFGPAATDDQKQAVISALSNYAEPATIATVSGNQWGLAIGELGLADQWEANVTAAKSKYRIRVALLSRDTEIKENDPLMIRVCGSTIPFSAVFSHAQAMPAS